MTKLAAPKARPNVQLVRCAIYTRKSTEEGRVPHTSRPEGISCARRFAAPMYAFECGPVRNDGSLTQMWMNQRSCRGRGTQTDEIDNFV